jgi:3-dehydroquinate dehydratase-2
MRVSIINGPNLNLLGHRQPEIYGNTDLATLEKLLKAEFSDFELMFFQSNHEGLLIDYIHGLIGKVDYIVINPGGLAHTSVILFDALQSVSIPYIEVHISNIYSRESFRLGSYVSRGAMSVITGFGIEGYFISMRYLRTIKRG